MGVSLCEVSFWSDAFSGVCGVVITGVSL
jgi:hypothetical protein